MNNLQELEKKIGVTFSNKEILYQAMSHSSFANEKFCKNNETMEFLGDAVLDVCVSKYLFTRTELAEGEMTKARAKYVCEEALNLYASKISLNKYIMLGHGEELTGGRNRQALIADAYEALLGAVFLEFGFDKCYEVFQRIVIPYINMVDVLDYKSKLQELMQADQRRISYEIVDEYGLPHEKTFVAEVKLENEICLGKGSGKTKKEAEQNAAHQALNKIAK